MAKWLRRKADGVIYGWHPVLAARTDILEEVSEEEAFPEKFVPKNAQAKDLGLKHKLSVDETVATKLDPKNQTPVALAKDAAKGLAAKGLA